MSAPIISCSMLDACAPLIDEAGRAIGGAIALSRTCSDSDAWWTVFLHVDSEAYCGSGKTPSEALMVANGKRKTAEDQASAAHTQPVIGGDV